MKSRGRETKKTSVRGFAVDEEILLQRGAINLFQIREARY